MKDYRSILKRVGYVLIALGVTDIAVMILSISLGRGYSSSFNIFAVLAGGFLVREHLGATGLVTRLSAFMLAAFTSALVLLMPFVQPFGLLATEARLQPTVFMTSSLTALVTWMALVWSYRQLRSPPVLAALAASGRSVTAPRWMMAAGLGLVVVMSIAFQLTLNGDAGHRAMALARKQLGPAYSYATESIQWRDGHAHAVVAAYNSREVKHVLVSW